MTTARKAYHDKINELNARINLLCVLIREHGAAIDNRHWGHVGDMERVRELLGQAIEAVPAPPTNYNNALIDRAYQEMEDEARRNRRMARGV